MYEPADPVVRVPTGGWPRAMVRLDLMPSTREGGLTLPQAIYEMAGYARKHRIGVVALFNGVDLPALPNQTTAEIAATFQRLAHEADTTATNVCELPVIGVLRWTPLRKGGVVAAIRMGELSREVAMGIYRITEDELADWEAKFDAGGVRALRVSTRTPLRSVAG